MAYTPKSVLNEFTFPGVVQQGSNSDAAKRVQEWITLHGFYTTPDSDLAALL
jgi:hypothetical protein